MKLPVIPFIGSLLLSAACWAADLPPIVSEGVVNAPRAQVWRAWTTGEGLRSWLAPLAEIDLRVDGLMRSNYNPKGQLGDEGTIENRVLAFEPERMLAIKVAKAPRTFPFPNAVQSMWTVIYLTDAPNGQTHVRAIGQGFTDDPESARMREFFQRGNDYTLAELGKRFVAAPGVGGQGQAVPSAQSLVGMWKVDLRPTPEAAPYFQQFVITKVSGDKSFEGTFYGAPISQARINGQWGALRIAFVTSDGSGSYHHSAVLSGGKLEGLTNATGRDFLSYWSATRQATTQ